MFPKIRQLHAWTGLALSVVLMTLSLSGVLLIFKDDYLQFSFSEARLDVASSPSELGEAIEAIEATFGIEELSYVSLAKPSFGLHHVVLLSGEAAYVSQDGDVIERWQPQDRIEDWIFHLHHYLFLGEFGKYLAGAVGLCAVLMAFSGIYLVWPFLGKFRLRALPQSLKRRDLVAYHRNTGIALSIPIILVLLTGAAMVFYAQASYLLLALTGSEQTPSIRPAATAGDIHWPTALVEAKQHFPDAMPRLVIWPRAETSPATIRFRSVGEWHQNGRTLAYIDPATSAALATQDAMKLTRGERAANAIYPLHSTGIGGRAYDALMALAGIALVLMTLFSSVSYVKLIRSRRRR